MIEFLKEFPWVAFAGAVVSVLGSITGLVLSIIDLRSHKHLKAALAKAKRRSTVIVCPHCKKETPLSDVHFLLPDGAVDDNLNGVPDTEE